MTSNAAAVEYLDYYLNDPKDAQSAVLIVGPWGSGKTHFIKEYLEQRHKKRLIAEPLTKNSYLYASLYGVTRPEQITDQFYAQAQPILNSKSARLFGSVVARAANIATGGNAVKEGDQSQIADFFRTSFDGMVLVFDDLERCSISISDALGFINTFVEHEGLKAIVIANETEILSPSGEVDQDYLRRKEKLIGKTLAVSADAGSVYDHLVGELRTADSRSAAIAHKAVALRTFAQAKAANFRSLRAILNDFDRILNSVDPRVRTKPAVLANLLSYMIATGIEFRSGQLTESEFPRLGTQRRVLMLSSREPTESETRVAEISERYPEVNWSDVAVPPSALARLYAAGELNVVGINAFLNEHPLVAGPLTTPTWRRLWRWPELSPVEYSKTRQEIVDALADRKLVHPAHILHVAGTMMSLKASGDDLIRPRKLLPYFREYLRDLVLSERLVPDIHMFNALHDTGWGGLGFHNVESDGFQSVYNSVRLATLKSFNASMKREAPSLFEKLRDDEDARSLLTEFGVAEGNFGEAPILHYMPLKEFAEICLRAGDLNDKLLASISYRHRSPSYNGFDLTLERPWLKRLRGELETRARKLGPPHKQITLSRLAYYFDRMNLLDASA